MSAKIPLMLSIFFGFLCSTSVALAKHSDENLTKSEIQEVLSTEGISEVFDVEQQIQDESTMLMLVVSNLHNESFNGCLANRFDIELVRSKMKWRVIGKSNQRMLSLLTCQESTSANFVFIFGEIPADLLADSVESLRQLLADSVPPEIVSYDSPALSQALKHASQENVLSVALKNGGVEFQVASKEISPLLIGVFLRYSKGNLVSIHVNSNNSLESVE